LVPWDIVELAASALTVLTGTKTVARADVIIDTISNAVF
jgi:hypothetical protein